MRLAHNTQKLSDMLKKKNKQQQQLSDMFVKMFLKNLWKTVAHMWHCSEACILQ